MISKQNKIILLKFLGLFSVVRGYNILIIVLAQYLSAIFIISPEKRALTVLLDPYLFLIVFPSSLCIASGYIINSFYDSKKDLINRPQKLMLDTMVSQSTRLKVYFSMNFFAVMLSFIVSWRAALFFSLYIFILWFYSHKIKRQLFYGNLMSAFLTILPFFGILLYYKNFYEVIYFHATFLFLLLLIKEILKDSQNINGDFANDYKTIPIVYGDVWSKYTITALCILTVVPIYFLIEIYDVGYMDTYFYICLLVLIFWLRYLWQSQQKQQYIKLHYILKLIIVSGVFCITLINPSILYNGKQLLMSHLF